MLSELFWRPSFYPYDFKPPKSLNIQTQKKNHIQISPIQNQPTGIQNGTFCQKPWLETRNLELVLNQNNIINRQIGMIQIINPHRVLQQNAQILQKANDMQLLNFLYVNAVALSIIRNHDNLIIRVLHERLDLVKLTFKIRSTSFFVCANCCVKVFKLLK